MCAVAGGDLSLKHLKSRLEAIVLAKPPLLPSVGQAIPRNWLLATTFLRALRDGRSPLKAVQSALTAHEASSNEPAADASADKERVAPRPFIALAEAHRMWAEDVMGPMEGVADAAVLDDGLTLLINQVCPCSTCIDPTPPLPAAPF